MLTLWLGTCIGSGIPQDFLLGPTLFIVYINGLVEHVNYGSDLYLYADDAVEFYLYPTVGTVLIHSVKPELTE